MRKALVFLIVALLVAGIMVVVGCGGDSPEAVVNKFIEAKRADNDATADSYIYGGNKNLMYEGLIFAYRGNTLELEICKAIQQPDRKPEGVSGQTDKLPCVYVPVLYSGEGYTTTTNNYVVLKTEYGWKINGIEKDVD
ncbi:hypothetical protein L6273_00625 [Candidatus Parcubacteria bacterium]|nr:hypothetical protein [Candidatus Parcubacteria bacterium]